VRTIFLYFSLRPNLANLTAHHLLSIHYKIQLRDTLIARHLKINFDGCLTNLSPKPDLKRIAISRTDTHGHTRKVI